VAGGMDEVAVADLVLPLPFPLRAPSLREALEDDVVGRPDSISLHHDVKAPFPVVTTCRKHDVRIAP